MRNTRNPPKVYDYHGIPIHYRVEKRKSSKRPTLLLSLREGHRKILYKGSLRRFPKSCPDETYTLQALELRTPDFLAKCLEPNSPDGLERRISFAQKGLLTFGAVYDLDMAYFCKKYHWRKVTLSKYNQQMKPLLDSCHKLPLDQLTPVSCMSLLKEQSDNERCSCINLVKKIFAFECVLGTYQENPWLNYTPQTPRKKTKTMENLKQAELTTEQCREVLKLCMQNITSMTNGSIYLAAAFLMLMGLPPKELCSLTYGDLKHTHEFKDCTVIQIHEERYRKEGTKQYTHLPILEGYRRRTLALPDVLVDLCTVHLATFPKTMTDEDKAQCPLIHSPKNRMAAMRPNDLCKSLQKIFGQICEASQFGGRFPVENRLIATAKSNLRWVGFTEEKMCYHFGWTPKTTASKSYINFADESQLERCRRKLERWTRKLCATLPDRAELNSKKKKSIETGAFYPDPERVCLLQGTFQPFSEDDINIPTLDLEISSTSGLASVKIEYIKLIDGKDR